MNYSIEYLDYKHTNSFSALAIDYVEGSENLSPYFRYTPNIAGMAEAIANRKKNPCNRAVLVEQLKLQYAGKNLAPKLEANLQKLLHENCFTITTAHQPNIFTGHLYFIYKIMHVIKLADEMKLADPQHDFVPVFYMGSEDADLEELGNITVNGKKYKWKTDQQGAVGRMYIDKPFLKLIQGLKGQLSVEPYGTEIMDQVEKAYQLGKTIEQASFDFVHDLLGHYGLLVLLPDNKELKKLFQPIVEKEIFENFSHSILSETIAGFPAGYKIQAAGREINFFYLIENRRERIYKSGNEFRIDNMDLRFDEVSMRQEIENFPERFSANVILRPVFQEMILPNIAFIGGGGELAYWLELKNIFDAADVPYPLLVLRNSFLLLHKKTTSNVKKLGLKTKDVFHSEQDMLNQIVRRDSQKQLSLSEEKFSLMKIYNQIRNTAVDIDKTLERHVWALQSAAVNKISQLEKKMLRAAKKDFDLQQKRIQKIRSLVFPGGVLQERVENILGLYAMYGPGFMNLLYEHSKGLDQKFTVIQMEADRKQNKSD